MNVICELVTGSTGCGDRYDGVRLRTDNDGANAQPGGDAEGEEGVGRSDRSGEGGG